MKTYNICYITNDDYVMPTIVSIISLLKNNPNTAFNVGIIGDGINESNKNIINNIDNDHCKIELIDMSCIWQEKVANECINTSGTHVTQSALFKFDIPNVFSGWNKALYIDSDILINGSIVSLYNTDIKDYYMAAVNDMGIKANALLGKEDFAKKVGINFETYFNSGVLLLNLKKLRDDDVPDKLKSFRKNNNTHFMDQDALNVCIGKNCLLLPYKYNFRVPLLYELPFTKINEFFYKNKYKTYEDVINGQIILHMTGKYKPWKYRTRYISEIFEKYYEEGLLKEPLKYKDNIENVLFSEKDDLNTIVGKMDWHFPYEKIPRGSDVILFGAGNVGKSFYTNNNYTKYCNIKLWVDSNSERWNSIVFSPNEILRAKYDYILIAIYKNDYIKEIKALLSEMGIERNIVTLQ